LLLSGDLHDGDVLIGVGIFIALAVLIVLAVGGNL